VGAIQFLFLASASQTPVLRPLSNWALFATFLYFFVMGYLIYRLPPLTHGIRAVAVTALALAFASLILMEIVDRTRHAPTSAFTSAFLAYCALRGYVSWLWVAGLLGLGMRYLAYSPRWLPYMTEATYPAYIIHMPILSFIALFVVGWQAPLVLKFVVIAVTTCVAVLGVYDGAIKRVPLLRFLFGLKPLHARAHADDPSPPPNAVASPRPNTSLATVQARR
jgi:surface polysaccharide O-acyltransferase-like enzyme